MIRDALGRFVAGGERVLVGFDFPYGYPAGLAAALGLVGPPWLAVWEYLVNHVQDDVETNASNRFRVAAGINARLERHVFWGRPPSQAYDDLSARRDRVIYQPEGEQDGLAEWREVEAILRGRGYQPQPAWKLFGNGFWAAKRLCGSGGRSRMAG